jgi:hypothetical protein
VSQKTLHRYAQAGLWALPVYGLVNLIGTITSQPDYKTDFPAYARYVSTTPFLVSHLAASILGTGIGLLGFAALFIYLASGRRSGVALAGFVTTMLGNMALVALFGVAAFAQPAIGKAFLAGHRDVIALNSSVYGTPLNTTAVAGLVLFFAGAVLFAIAIWGSESLPRAAGIVFAVAVPIFAIGSLQGNVLAPIGALLEMGSAIWIAFSASKTARPSTGSRESRSRRGAPQR